MDGASTDTSRPLSSQDNDLFLFEPDLDPLPSAGLKQVHCHLLVNHL